MNVSLYTRVLSFPGINESSSGKESAPVPSGLHSSSQASTVGIQNIITILRGYLVTLTVFIPCNSQLTTLSPLLIILSGSTILRNALSFIGVTARLGNVRVGIGIVELCLATSTINNNSKARL